MLQRTVIILVGPKGSGKTHIGGLIQRRLGVPFLRVEPLVLTVIHNSKLTGFELEKEEFHAEEAAIDAALNESDVVAFEATGSSNYWPTVLRRLRSKYAVKQVRIRCPPDVCVERVKQRSLKDHIPVSDERLKAINAKAGMVEDDWDLEIDNSGPASDEEILARFRSVLSEHPLRRDVEQR